MQTITNR